MKRKPVTALVAAVNDALKRAAARANGREEEFRADLAKADAERDRLIEAIASGGDSFAAVRDRLAAVEEKIAAATADLERARFEKRAAATPPKITVNHVLAYLWELRRLVKADVAKANAGQTAAQWITRTGFGHSHLASG